MTHIALILFSLLTIGAGSLTYMNIGTEEKILEKNSSVRSGSMGAYGFGGGYRGGK